MPLPQWLSAATHVSQVGNTSVSESHLRQQDGVRKDDVGNDAGADDKSPARDALHAARERRSRSVIPHFARHAARIHEAGVTVLLLVSLFPHEMRRHCNHVWQLILSGRCRGRQIKSYCRC